QSGAARPRRPRYAPPCAGAGRAFRGDPARARLCTGRDCRTRFGRRDAARGGGRRGRGRIASELAMPLARRFLYVPAHREKILDKAVGLPADAPPLALEGAVPPAEKAVAPPAGRGL